MRGRQAFSLIELIIVLAVMAIMLTVATSSLLAMRRNTQVRSAIDRYVAKHSFARATAVRMGRTAQLRSDTVGRRLWVEVQGKTIGGVTYFDDGLRFRTNRAILCFDPRGLATTGGTCHTPDATVVFTNAHRSDTVQTTMLGRVMR